MLRIGEAWPKIESTSRLGPEYGVSPSVIAQRSEAKQALYITDITHLGNLDRCGPFGQYNAFK